MSALIAARDPLIPVSAACSAVGMARATLYRHTKPKNARAATTRPCNRRRLSEPERQAVLDVLHEPRFADQPPAQVYAKLLDEGRYLCSIRTMHRLLAERGESGERRVQRGKDPSCGPAPFGRCTQCGVELGHHQVGYLGQGSVFEPVRGARSV